MTTTTIAPLTYHNGAEMKLAPVNLPYDDVISALRGNAPVVVILEPGDATRYTLLLQPVAMPFIGGYLGAFGIPAYDADRYLLVTRLGSQGMRTVWLPLHDGPIAEHHVAGLTANEWSRALYAWWLRHVQRDLTSV